jgi:hypothetical protein
MINARNCGANVKGEEYAGEVQSPANGRWRGFGRAKRGEAKKSELKGASKSMVESMTERELQDLASTKRKGKPDHVKAS